MKKIYICLPLLLILGLIFVTSAQASEQIETFTAAIDVQADGKIHIRETIEYDFGDTPHHGITRDISYIKTNKDNKRYELDMTINSITDPQSRAYRFQQSYNGDYLHLQIGDPNTTITGLHTYIIDYTVSGAVAYYSDHDELYWQITGTENKVPIAKAVATVTVAGVDAAQLRVACFTGMNTSAAGNCATNTTAAGVSITALQGFIPGEGLTAVMSFPKGKVAVLEPRAAGTIKWTLSTILFVLLAALLALVWYVLYPLWLPLRWILYGRDPHTGGSARAWFDLPKGKSGRPLTPAETGTLIDESADQQDVMATIVDLARRGYFQIIEKQKKSLFFKHRAYTLKKLYTKSTEELQSFEKILLKDLFTGEDEVEVDDLQLADTFAQVEDKLYRRLVEEGLFPRNPSNVRNFYYLIMGSSLFTLNLPLLVSAFIFGPHMPNKTLFGAQQKDVAMSLKNFLKSQERQLEFQAEKQYMFEKLLPYAIAFGVEKVWADRFKDLALRQPNWFQTYDKRAFNSYTFIHSMNSSLASISSSARPAYTATSISSSSGFSSGFSGGSVGGGGGGGGTGSW